MNFNYFNVQLEAFQSSMDFKGWISYEKCIHHLTHIFPQYGNDPHFGNLVPNWGDFKDTPKNEDETIIKGWKWGQTKDYLWDKFIKNLFLVVYFLMCRHDLKLCTFLYWDVTTPLDLHRTHMHLFLLVY